ncbi:MAG: DNA cytosine methyltransferase [Parabacteroides sp.]|nr:DNA cytosine methyltransferase [Parabacteroides sp.]
MGKVHASLFSGFGAADLAATWMGWDNAFWCEIDGFPRKVLSYWFPKSIGYGNIKETDFTPWRGKIDVLTGGFPCQPFSVAGQRKGQEDDRYLWPEMLRAIREIRPTWVIGENVGGIISMVQPGCETEVEHQASLFEETDKETILEQEYVVETICRDLEQEGYSVQPVVIPACAVGAPHRRDRIFFIAHCANARAESMQREGENRVYESGVTPYADSSGRVQFGKRRNICHEEQHDSDQKQKRSEQQVGAGRCGKTWASSNTNGQQLENSQRTWDRFSELTNFHSKRDWQDFPAQPPVCRGNDGLPFDVVRLTISITAWCTGSIKGYGNAIVPQVMYEVFKAIETIQE